jgi:excisionase family DNA binding protein
MAELNERLWNVATVAKFLGISSDDVYRAVKSGELPHARFGRAIRFIPAYVRAYAAALDADPSPPAPDPAPRSVSPEPKDDGCWVLLNREVLALQGIHLITDDERKRAGENALLELIDRDQGRLRQLLAERGYALVTVEQSRALKAMARAFGQEVK